MKLDREAVAEFRKLWQEEFDEELSSDEAEKTARELVSLYELMVQEP